MKQNNKQRKQEYKQAIRPMGVFQIRNLVNERIFVAAGINLTGTINRHRFELGAGVHANQQLQLDWNAQAKDTFAFEILDQMNPAADPLSARKDLETLEEMWLKKLRPYDERGYNQRQLSRHERLKRIAARGER
jgi:nitrate/nitrite-specific signal transduction histidine kinase